MNKAFAIATRQQSAIRSEEHTSELQSRLHLVCRLLLEKKTHDALGQGFQGQPVGYADSGRHDLDVGKGLRAPFQKLVTLPLAAEFTLELALSSHRRPLQ